MKLPAVKKSCVSQSRFKLSGGIFYRSDISHFGKIPRCYCGLKKKIMELPEKRKLKS
jgi:hypothetical protein